MTHFPRGPVSLLIMTGGLIVWALCFVVLYAGMSLACAWNMPTFTWGGLHGINWLLAVLWVAHLIPLAWMTWASVRRARQAYAAQADAPVRFGWRITAVLNGISLVGTVWIGFPVLFMVPCF